MSRLQVYAIWAICTSLSGTLVCSTFSAEHGGEELHSVPSPLGLQAVSNPGDSGAEVPQMYRQGETALREGKLGTAEACFRKVLAAEPNSAGANANLGVIEMRRRNWSEALKHLRAAEQLAPNVVGIRLNIGLVYYHENEFRSAIPPFESVVRSEPGSTQARYLLGLCYFFTDRYAEAANDLQALWDQESNDINYLYVLGNAANKAGRSELENRALLRFVEIGHDTAEYHLLMGKAFLNRQNDQSAIPELREAIRLDPKLPFAHFNLGLAYLGDRDFGRAKDEFLKDIRIEPDVAFNYDRLGLVYLYMEDDAKAEENFRDALHLDPNLASSYYGLARLYQREKKYAEALSAATSAVKMSPDIGSYHYLKGQLLGRLGRKQDAKVELDESTRLLNASNAKVGDFYDGPLPQPELTTVPQR
jgi:tetratricopeptide (TPR) repeat protein